MRRCLLALLVLTACQMAAPQDAVEPGVTPITGDEIAVTTLADAPPVADATPATPVTPSSQPAPAAGAPPALVAGPDTPHPKPRPVATPESPAPETPTVETPAPEASPAEPPSPQQLLCEKSGGQWAKAGDTGANVCVKRTRDQGKHCSKKSDCEGECLARSQTCSPIEPMIGCNDVLDGDGRRMTLCLN